MNDIKACVIGLGAMGRNHARVLSELAQVNLVGVSDPSDKARAAYRCPAGVQVFADHREMIERTNEAGLRGHRRSDGAPLRDQL